jgi:hypothetical protein
MDYETLGFYFRAYSLQPTAYGCKSHLTNMSISLTLVPSKISPSKDKLYILRMVYPLFDKELHFANPLKSTV